jgi:hypothetical protein
MDLETLRLAAVRRADMERKLGNFLPTAEATRYINEGISELHSLLSKSMPERFLDIDVRTTTPGVQSVQLPSDYRGTFSVDVAAPSEKLGPMRQFNWLERHRAGYYDTGKPRRYLVGADGVLLAPQPDAVYAIHHAYLPAPPVLVNDADDLPPGFEGWEDFIELHAAVNCLLKEESDASKLEVKLNQKREMLREMAELRSMVPSTVVDVNRDDFEDVASRRGYW